MSYSKFLELYFKIVEEFIYFAWFCAFQFYSPFGLELKAERGRLELY